MRFKFVYLFLLTLFFTPVCINAQTKRALVIGIGNYEDSAWDKINGDKDVPYVLEILNNANYSQIITCVNEGSDKGRRNYSCRTLNCNGFTN
jgi:hypothetical protein